MRVFLVMIVLLASAHIRAAWAEESASTTAVFEGTPASHWIAELEKDDVAARRKAVHALFKLRPAAKDGAGLLARSFEDDEYVRDTAYKALVGLGEHARTARLCARR